MKIFSQSEILEQVKDFLEVSPNGVLEILGPTASGKTGLSIELARFLQSECGKNVEIISVDSRQVFRECDISSAKITPEEMKGVPHHGLDLVNLDEAYNVVQFQAYAFRTIEEIKQRGNVPVLCGGTMLWLDAISENYVFSFEKNAQGEFEKSNDKSEPKWPVFKIGLHWERELLYERIDQRAVIQFEQGMIEETQQLSEKYGVQNSDDTGQITRSAWTSFGYQEILAYLRRDLSYDEALELNQKRNRNYAKRQLTWWRGRDDVNWLNLS